MLRLPAIAPTLRARRSLHVAAHTLPRPTAASLTAHLAAQKLVPGSAILYTLHPDLPDLDSLVRTFQSQTTPSVGSIALSAPTDEQTQGPAASILVFNPTSPSDRITPFHSAISGRPAAQVGKWQRDPLLRERKVGEGKRQEDRKGEEVGEMERVMLGLGVSGGAAQGEGRLMGWDALWRSGRDVEGAADEHGPGELQGVQGINSMVLLADGTPDALLRMLNARYPDVQKLGLITYPTPFLTNRPFTFFHNQAVYEHGAVGIALSGMNERAEGGVVYPGLEPLGPVEEIAQAQGNLLLRLEPSPSAAGGGPITNPTQALIRAINAFRATLTSHASEAIRPADASSAARGISLGKGMKEEEYYLALYDSRCETPYQVVKIMSGDPSRGAISLEMDEPLLTGQKVQFMHKPPASIPGFALRPNEVSFTTLPQEEYTASPPAPRGEAEADVRPGFAVGSEGGFFFSDVTGSDGARVETGVCKVTGARGFLRFPIE